MLRTGAIVCDKYDLSNQRMTFTDGIVWKCDGIVVTEFASYFSVYFTAG